MPGLIKSYFLGYLSIVHDAWINVCAVFTTALMIGLFVPIQTSQP
jgi:hypothetical protein